MSGTRAEFFKCQGEYRNQASEVHSPLVRQAYNSVSCNAWPGGVNSDPADPTHPDSEVCLFFWEVATVFLYDLKHNTISGSLQIISCEFAVLEIRHSRDKYIRTSL